MQRSSDRPPGTAAEPALRRLGDALSEAMIGVRAGRIAWATARLAELTGEGDVTSLLGLPFEALFEDAGEGLPCDDPGRAVECQLRRGDGREARVSVRCLCGDSEQAPDRVWLLHDVSRQRRLEAELLRASRDLHRANRELESLREHMRRDLADREELLTVVTHELRTPLTVILGYVRLLLSGQVGPLNEEQRRFLGETQKSCQGLNAFVANLLETARSLRGEPVLEASELPVDATIQSVAAFLKPLLDERRLEIRLMPGAHVPRARFDAARIEQVLTNLIGNAIKYAPLGSTIDIATRCVESGDFVEVEISDAGPGVGDADRERIFEPYVRLGAGSPAGGLGLGLAIARRIVAAHGGEIGVRAREGAGSCFYFTLPVASPAVAEGA